MQYKSHQNFHTDCIPSLPAYSTQWLFDYLVPIHICQSLVSREVFFGPSKHMDITAPSQSLDRVRMSPHSAHCFLRVNVVGQSLDGSRRFIHQVRSPRIAGLARFPFALELHTVNFRPSETTLFLGFGEYIDRSPRRAFSCNDRLCCKLLRGVLTTVQVSPLQPSDWYKKKHFTAHFLLLTPRLRSSCHDAFGYRHIGTSNQSLLS